MKIAIPLIDILLVLLFLLLMAAPHTGSVAHEWLGILLFVVFLIHTWMNRVWYKNLNKGKYNSTRTIRVMLNSLLLLSMIGTLASAILISRTVFTFAGFSGGLSFRTIHVFCAHWCFILAAIHLGLYSKRFSSSLMRVFSYTQPQSYRLIIYGIGFIFAAHGIDAFLRRELIYPMTMRSSFMLWSENAALFILDYSSIFFLFIYITIIFSFLVYAKKNIHNDLAIYQFKSSSKNSISKRSKP